MPHKKSQEMSRSHCLSISLGGGSNPSWNAVVTFYEIDNVGYKKTGKSASFSVSNTNPAELYTWTSSVTSFVVHVSAISNASVTVYMTQAVESALERILLTEPSSGTKAMPSDIVGCAAEYVAGQGWIGNLGVLDSKAVLDSFPTNALVPGKVWAIVASASSFAKYNYMSAGWVLESSVGATGASNLPGSLPNPFTTLEALAAAYPVAGAVPLQTPMWVSPGVEYRYQGGAGVGAWAQDYQLAASKARLAPSRILPYLRTLDHTAPTVTLANVTVNSASLGAVPFAGAKLLRPNAQLANASVPQPFSVSDGVQLDRGTTWPYYVYVAAGYLQGGGGNLGFYRPIYSINTNSDKVALFFQANAASLIFRYRVNGVSYETTQTTVSGLWYTLLITMGSGPNYVEFTNLSSHNFIGIYVDSALTYSPWKRDLKISCIGDSITGSVGDYKFDTNWMGIVCAALGAEQLNYSIGGSGWLTGNDTKGKSTAFRARIPFAAYPQPDVHFWFGGVNDSGDDVGEMRAEVNYCVNEFAKISPKTKQIIIGRWTLENGGVSSVRHNAELRNAAIDCDVPFVDLMTAYTRDDALNYTKPVVANGSTGMWVDAASGIGWSWNLTDADPTQTSLITPENVGAYINSASLPHPTLAGQKALANRVLGELIGM